MIMMMDGEDKNDDDVYPGECRGEIGTGYISADSLSAARISPHTPLTLAHFYQDIFLYIIRDAFRKKRD